MHLLLPMPAPCQPFRVCKHAKAPHTCFSCSCSQGLLALVGATATVVFSYVFPSLVVLKCKPSTAQRAGESPPCWYRRGVPGGGGGGPARSLQQVGTKCPDIICSGSAAQQHITACLGLLPNGMRSLVALCMALANPHRSPSHLHGAGAYGLLGLGALMSATAIYNHIIGAELE